MKKIFTLLTALVVALSVFAQNDHLSANRSNLDPALEPFYHGVASGDPLSNAVILWTRITTASATPTVNWEMATDLGFTNNLVSGTVTTDAGKDYTVKVDVSGLQPNTWYYYRFSHNGVNSIIGRTRTAPVGDVDSLRFAVVACSNYQAGYFNAYKDIAMRNDVDAVLHLGDYYYEYEAEGYGFDGDTTRLHEPDTEIYSLADYRQRHSQYKLDPDSRYVHQQYPFITVWDDHESANDSWHDGAGNHTPGTEGDWYDRKAASNKAYFEWMPIREASPGNDTTIHRTIPFGDLIDFIMIDTRLEGRQEPLGFGLSTSDSTLNDTARTLLGASQLAWFEGQLSASAAKWRIIGNQIMVAQLVAFNLVLNGDQWDGYPAERKRVFDHILNNNIDNVVFLTGDIHTSWGNDLPYNTGSYNASTGAGSVATEFVCTSVTSPALDQLNGISPAFVTQLNPYMKYVDFAKRGYLLLDVNKNRVQGDWIHMSTVTSRNFTANDAAQKQNLTQERFLRNGSGPLGPRAGMPAQAPPVFATAIEKPEQEIIGISCFPNPTVSEISLQYYTFKPGNITIRVTNMNGQVMMEQTEKRTEAGLYNSEVNVAQLAAGSYIISIVENNSVYSKTFVKN
jgi:alkaline phosphatase D